MDKRISESTVFESAEPELKNAASTTECESSQPNALSCKRIGYALCGSHCTVGRSLEIMADIKSRGAIILPIISDSVAKTDTRFGRAAEIRKRIVKISGQEPIEDIRSAEPLGPKEPQDLMIVSPCTGNTLAKLAYGITDTPVTMAVKAHLRRSRPTLIALATNDALSANLKSLALLLERKGVFFVPLVQDDPIGKPHSLVADFNLIPAAAEAALVGKQLRPLFLEKS